MKPSKNPFRHFSLFALSTSALFVTQEVRAVDRYWDQNAATSGMGGTGNWETTSSFWRTDAGADANGGTLGTWVNYVDDTTTNAVLSGTGGTLTTTAAIVTNKVTVNSGAFIISNGTGGGFSFNGNNRAISVASGASLRLNPQISGGITLAISGGGTTTFAATNRAYRGSLAVTGSGTKVIISGGNGLDNGSSSGHSFASGTTLQLGSSTNYRSTLTLNGATLELNSALGFVTQRGFNLSVTGSKSTVTSLLTNTGTSTANYGAIGGNTGSNGIFTVANTNHVSGVDLEYSAGWRNGTMGKAGAGTLRLNAGFIMNRANDYTTFSNAGTALNLTAGIFLNEGLVKSIANVNGTTSVLKTDSSSGSFDQIDVTNGVFEVSRSSDLFTTGLTYASGNKALNLRGGTLKYVGINTDYSSQMGDLTGTSLVDTNGQDVTFASDLTGAGVISKTGAGTLKLSGNNSFGPGTLSFGSGSQDRGYIRLTHNNALGITTAITLAGSGAGISGLQLEGGGVTISQSLNTVGRNSSDTTGYVLRNISGDNAWNGALTITDGGGSYGIISDSGTLTLGGTIQSTYVSGFGTRSMSFSGAGSFNVTGDILGGGPNSQNIAISKSGAGTLTLGGTNTYTGDTTVNGGTLALTHASALQGSSFNSSGAGALSFGSLTAASFGGLKGSNNLELQNSSSAAVALTVGGNDQSTTFSGSLSGSGSITKTGIGTLTLSNDNTYTGATHINNGTLALTATAALGNTSTTIAAVATLTGGGSFGGAVTINGTHAPGFSPGTQTFEAGLSYGSTSTLEWELTDNTIGARGTKYDAVDVTGGSFTLNSAATLDLAFSGSVDFLNAFWNSSQQWLVVDLNGATAADSNLFTLGSITGGLNYSPTLGDFGILRQPGSTSENSVYLTWTPVPEPSTAFLGSLGLLALLRRRHRDVRQPLA
jgi:autotransporter-associated beta strand protein